ncbi:MAG: DUF58 domain-containing protein [Dehalococcoidia bacterium]
MNRDTLAVLSRGYVLLLLLGAVIISPSPQAWIMAPLLVAHAFTLYRPLRAQWDLMITLLASLLTPLALAPALGSLPAVFLVIPVLPLLDRELRALGPQQPMHPFRTGRWSSSTLNSLTLVLIGVGVIGILMGNTVLLAVAGILLMALLGRLIVVAVKVTKAPVQGEAGLLRVLAMEEAKTGISLRNRSPFPLLVRATSPYPWLRVQPEVHLLEPQSATMLEVTVTPPLAGPGSPELQVTSLDPWRMVWTGQSLRPLELHVIPRARYAAWLAKRYLEQVGTQRGPSTSAGLVGRVRGVEYHSLRQYQPGDRLRDIDWRHTTKFRELVVKEYRDPEMGGALLLVNLVAAHPEEADWLSYHLVTSALTAARQGLPPALAAYDQKEVVSTTGPLHPREAVKAALRLSGHLRVLGQEERLLAAPNPLRLRRELQVHGVNGNDKGPGAGLAAMIRLELEALETMTRGHPLTRALQRALPQTLPPAVVTIISPWNHDTEALAMALPRLRSRGYTVVDLRAGGR